ncbi:E3 ubiquitin-protein ligase RNF19B-like isoform X3 [Dromaius novaehollandiae]|uniref:E3 ubiquitin-protein ligase RNF19B-like isoform X3 n=1 Tax=Dromaius novaehollandiae TaxID=8790 RepID=UPI00311D984E
MPWQQRVRPLPVGLHGPEAEDIKVCPRCGAFIMKINDGSCNRVSCTVCGCLLCWLCLREISDVRFLSPSGCTFWGKRPWSRSRKIPWQLGLVLGAPMAVSLAAGVAVPVIAIGIPVYMRRKVLGRSGKSSVSGCQSVTSSVLLSLFVSPIITVAVAAGAMGQEQASAAALAGNVLREGQDAARREGVDIEVEVEIEPGREQSRCSAPSGQSLAGGSPGGPAERGHRGRGPGSTEREPL